MKIGAIVTLLSLTAGIAIAYQIRATHRQAAPASLTSYVPRDALLTIESPDFASLLRQWNSSAESKAWLSSDSYAVFQNSRLFGRLGDAQTSFAKTAGVPAGVDLLIQVAGKESVFAWYDIGKLEFLYITRMPAAQAEQIQLLQSRASFQRRQAGNTDFYIRTANADYSTVAFARVPGSAGDLILLATREDLIANALQLIAAPSPANSIRQEQWFRDASSALPAEKSPPALHMVLNLDRIAYDPHFQSYWIQRNITWTRQFRAAASDLYVETTRFREERVLLPKSAQFQPSARDLAPLAALAPPSTGVFRAAATEDPSVAVLAIEEKLLGSYTGSPRDADYAPDPGLTTPRTGDSSDLEARIDALPPVSQTASMEGLAKVFQAARIDSVMTLSSAQDPVQQNSLWVPIHSAVVVHAAGSTNPQALATALQRALRGSLTTANIGIDFQPSDISGATVLALTGPRPLFFSISSSVAQGNLILLSDDHELLSKLLRNVAAGPPQTADSPATSIAVFNHASQRAPYLQITSLIDGTNKRAGDSRSMAATMSSEGSGAASTPALFSRNIGSLSEAFGSFQSERAVERLVDSDLRQTVTYDWQAR